MLEDPKLPFLAPLPRTLDFSPCWLQYIRRDQYSLKFAKNRSLKG